MADSHQVRVNYDTLLAGELQSITIPHDWQVSVLTILEEDQRISAGLAPAPRESPVWSMRTHRAMAIADLSQTKIREAGPKLIHSAF